MDILANFLIVNRKFLKKNRWLVNDLSHALLSSLNRSLLSSTATCIRRNTDR